MKLAEIIKEKIKKEGAIPFDEYMEMALYYPEYGYYMKKNIKFGKEGDFFTTYHLGCTFGFLLSKYIKKLWEKAEYKKYFTITEIGPGDGFLAKDILENSNFIFRYNLVEMNQYLVKLQAEKLKNYENKTYWYDSIQKVEPFCGVVICNEVFDALPVRVFEINDRKLREVYITLNKNEEFIEKLLDARQDTLAFLEEFAPWVFSFKRFRSEINLEAKKIIYSISHILKKGFLLIFDYGYTSEEFYNDLRSKGTLLCYYKHSINENPYINIGNQDITAHVNFTALKKWAEKAGFRLKEFSSQSKFLISLCNKETLEEIYKKDLTQHLKRLILPHGMGQTHKVMILSK